MEKRTYVFDNFKFFTIVCIILGHMIQPYFMQTTTLRGLYYFVYSFDVPAFVFMSGLFSKGVLSQRVKVLENVVFFLVLALLNDMAVSIVNLCWGRQAAFVPLRRNSLGWYIVSLAYWYVITYLMRGINPNGLLIFSVLLGCFIGYDTDLGDTLHLFRTIVYYPIFLLGYRLDPKTLAQKLNSLPARIAGACGIFCLMYFCFFQTQIFFPYATLLGGRYAYRDYQLPYGGFYRLVYYVIVMFIILCFIAVMPKRKTIFSEWGKRSLQPYLLHMSLFVYHMRFLDIGEKIHQRIGSWGGNWILLYVIICVIIAIFFSSKIFSYPFQWIRNQCKIQDRGKTKISV